MSPTRTTADNLILRLVNDIHTRSSRPMLRAQLVKLVYLTDYIYSKQTGKTLTGFRYWWDYHGPNAEGNQIVARGNLLDESGLLRLQKRPRKDGNPTFLYYPVKGVQGPRFGDSVAEAIISKVVEDYWQLDTNAITKVSKSTRPFENAKQHQPLDLSSDSEIQEDLKALEGKLRAEGLRHGPLVSMKELKARYGFR